MPGNLGPPGPEVGEGRLPGEPANVEKVVTKPPITTSHREETGSLNRSGSSARQCETDTLRPEMGARRRRRDSRRLPPIGTCGCIREPLADRHRCGAKISHRQLQGAVDAAHHILDAGYLPIFDVPTLRELWKSGHHQLVDELRGGAR